jgi:hypothetical protein
VRWDNQFEGFGSGGTFDSGDTLMLGIDWAPQ